MPKQLTTQNATITTAAVEVKTLTISGKQVTLAVFRQLREEPLIDHDGTLLGTPWGYVNYHPDKCDNSYAHRHIVWQKGSELLRARVDDTPDFDRVVHGDHHPGHWHSSAVVNRYLAVVVHAGLMAGGVSVLEHRPRPSFWDEIYSADSHVARLELPAGLAGTDVFLVVGHASDAAVTAADLAERFRVRQAEAEKDLTDYERGRPVEAQARILAGRQRDADKARESYDDAMRALRNLIDGWGGFDAVNDAYGAEIEAEEARRQGQRKARTILADLPQLFIAV